MHSACSWSIFSIDVVTNCFDSSSNRDVGGHHIPRRPTPRSLESPNLTLQKLEQSVDPDKDDASIVELKRVLLNRIADLELSKTLEKPNDERDKNSELADLVPSPSFVEDTALEEETEKTPLDKLD
jgi:hypothetical protein